MKVGVCFDESDIKSVVNQKGYSKELVMRCANLGGVLRPYKQIEKGDPNSQLVHEL